MDVALMRVEANSAVANGSFVKLERENKLISSFAYDLLNS
jgi:hypothetical protein